MSSFPDSWVTTLLFEIASIQMGQSPNSHSYNENGDGLPFFQGKAEFGKLFPQVRKWCTDPKKIAEVGDILLSVRAPVGSTNLAAEKCCIGRGLAAIRADALLNQKYLLYYFRNIETWLTQQGTGSTFAAISSDFIRKLEVPVAPFNEQKRIADKLDVMLARIDACKERLKRIPRILKRFRQAVLAAATSGQLTEDWRNTHNTNKMARWVSLKDVASMFTYGSSAKSSPSGSIPVLRMGNIQEGTLDWNNLVFTSDINEIEKYRLLTGDVLFNRTNSPELVGKTAVYKGERPAIFAGYLIRVRCSADLLPDYLSYCLNSPAGRDYCWRVKSDGINQSNINARKLAAFEFELPPVEEQAEIVRRTEALFAFADRLEARYKAARTKIERLTPLLLAKAFRGELLPQDPNDEPALSLLERIRVERAAQPAKAKKAMTPRKPAMTKMTKESVKEVIQQLPNDKFSFDELRENLTGDYDSLKDILFTLLSEAEPILTQVFDQEERTMCFFRAGK